MSARLRIPVLLGALVLATTSASASAQECTDGQVSSPETAGHCCWPGQTFSAALGRCEGPPRCPEDLVPEGDTCVARQLEESVEVERPADATEAVSAARRARPTTASRLPPRAPGTATAAGAAPGQRTPWGPALGPGPSTSGLLWPASPDLDGAVRDPTLVHGTDDGLLLAGLLTFGAGYVAAILVGVADQAARNCTDFSSGFFNSTGCDSWPLSFVPVVGGILAGSVSYNGSRSTPILGIVAGPFTAAAQILGLVIVGIALASPTTDVVPAVDLGDARLSFLPHASPESAGLALALEL
jgi:hypothetical protein